MNNIEFVCSDAEVLKNHPVMPAKKVIPAWYKKLANETQIHIAGDTIPTIKKCMPVMDIIAVSMLITLNC